LATLREERARLQFLEEHGHGDEKVHVVFVDREAKERVKNDKQKTRFQWETDFPGGYAELNKGKDRLMRIIGNKQVAITVAGILWNETPEDALRRLAEQETEAEKQSLGMA